MAYRVGTESGSYAASVRWALVPMIGGWPHTGSEPAPLDSRPRVEVRDPSGEGEARGTDRCPLGRGAPAPTSGRISNRRHSLSSPGRCSPARLAARLRFRTVRASGWPTLSRVNRCSRAAFASREDRSNWGPASLRGAHHFLERPDVVVSPRERPQEAGGRATDAAEFAAELLGVRSRSPRTSSGMSERRSRRGGTRRLNRSVSTRWSLWNALDPSSLTSLKGGPARVRTSVPQGGAMTHAEPRFRRMRSRLGGSGGPPSTSTKHATAGIRAFPLLPRVTAWV